jgi:hypothetical protein
MKSLTLPAWFFIRIFPSVKSYWYYFRYGDGCIIPFGFGFYTGSMFKKWTNVFAVYVCIFNFDFKLEIYGNPEILWKDNPGFKERKFEWYSQMRFEGMIRDIRHKKGAIS